MELPMESTAKSQRDIWRDRFDSQRASGKSVRAWCKAGDVPEHSFYWWRCKLGLSPAKKRSRRSSRPIEFAQVLVHPSIGKSKSPSAQPLLASDVGAMRLRLAGERELILPASMPIEQVARLVHAIEMMA
jgi:hypothetical protein